MGCGASSPTPGAASKANGVQEYAPPAPTSHPPAAAPAAYAAERDRKPDPSLVEKLEAWGFSEALNFFTQIHCFTLDDLQYLKEDDIESLPWPLLPRRKLWSKIKASHEPTQQSSPPRGVEEPAKQPLKKAPSVDGDPSDRPRCVISYRTADSFKRDETMQLVEELGFEGWHGGMVVAGSSDWMTQWIEWVGMEDTPIVVFLLSKAFVESPACVKEFLWVFNQPNLQVKAVPVMLEEVTLPDNFQFCLTGCNFVHGWLANWDESLIQTLRLKLRKKNLHVQYPNMRLFQGEDESGGAEAVPFEETLEKESKALRSDAAEALKGIADSVRLVGVIGSTNFNFSKSKSVTKRICEQLGRKMADVEEEELGKRTRVALVTGGCSGVGAVTAKAFHQRRMETEDGGLGLPKEGTGTFAVLPEDDPSLTSLAGVNSPLARVENGVRETVWVPRADGERSDGPMQRRPDSAGSALSSRTDRSARSARSKNLKFGDWLPVEEFGLTKHVGASDQMRKRFLAEALPIIIFIEGGPGAMYEAISAHSKNHIVLPLGCLGGGAGSFVAEHGKKIKKLMQGDPEFCPLFDQLQNSRVAEPSEDAEEFEELSHLLVDVDEGGPASQEPAAAKALTVAQTTDMVVKLLRLVLRRVTFLDQGLAHARDATAAEDNFDMWKEWLALPDRSLAPTTVIEPDSATALAKFIEDKGGSVVLIDGHGTKNQYKDMDEAAFEEKLWPVVQRLDALYNGGSKERRWVAMYGGDPFEPEKGVDASYIVHVLHHKFDVRIIATQADLYGKYILTVEAGPDGGKKMTLNDTYACLAGGAVMLYKTQYRENLAGQQEVMYGGLDEHGEYCGATSYWLHKEVEPFVKAHLVMGGGVIALQNAKICLDKRKRVLYIPCAAKVVLEDKQRAGVEWYGQVHDFMADAALQQALTNDCWRKLLVAPARDAAHHAREQTLLSLRGAAAPEEVPPMSDRVPFIELDREEARLGRQGRRGAAPQLR